jgi:excisionase family DNA binding protein
LARGVDTPSVPSVPRIPSGPLPFAAPLAASVSARAQGLALREARAELLTVAEVARELRVRPVTVYRLVGRGELPCVRVSNAIRVRREDLEAFIGRGGAP